MFRQPLILILFLLSFSAIDAQENKVQNTRWHGFLTQGYVLTSDNNFFGDSQNGSFEFTELGLNASSRVTDRLLISGQILSRNAGKMYKETPVVDFAVADYSLYLNGTSKSGVRLGRLKNTLGLYNETRDVAFTRPSNFVPEVIYFDKVRNLVLSSDGIAFYHDTFTLNGALSFTAGAGKTIVDKNVEIAYLFQDWPGSLDSDGVSLFFSGFYSTPDEQIKIGFSAAEASLKYDTVTSDPLSAGTTDFLYWIASFQYNQEKWSLSAEFMREPVSWKDYGFLRPDAKLIAEAYYLQSTFRVKPDIQMMIRYEYGYSDKDDKDGEKASALTGGLVPAFSLFSKTWTTGIRWDITPSFMLSAEYQVHQGTFILSARENPDLSKLKENWDMISILASYRF